MREEIKGESDVQKGAANETEQETEKDVVKENSDVSTGEEPKEEEIKGESEVQKGAANETEKDVTEEKKELNPDDEKAEETRNVIQEVVTEEKEEKNPDGEKAEEKVTEEDVTQGKGNEQEEAQKTDVTEVEEQNPDGEKAEEKVNEEGVTEGNKELNPDDEKAEETRNVIEEGVTEGNKELNPDDEEDATQGKGNEQEEAQKTDVTEGVIASKVKGCEQRVSRCDCFRRRRRKTQDNECETATGVIMTIDRDIDMESFEKPAGGCARYRPVAMYPDYYSAEEHGQGGSVR